MLLNPIYLPQNKTPTFGNWVTHNHFIYKREASYQIEFFLGPDACFSNQSGEWSGNPPSPPTSPSISPHRPPSPRPPHHQSGRGTRGKLTIRAYRRAPHAWFDREICFSETFLLKRTSSAAAMPRRRLEGSEGRRREGGGGREAKRKRVEEKTREEIKIRKRGKKKS